VIELVITADDLGIDPRRDDGIFAALERGAITQASLLVTGPTAPAASSRARRGGYALGLHLDLTEGAPCAPRDDACSLVDRTGRMLGKHGLRDAIARGEIAPAHVAREALAQLARFDALVGTRARHVDGHQHVHVIPELAEHLACAFVEAGVETTRIPEQRVVAGDDARARSFHERVSRDAARARTIYARRGIASTAAFVGLDVMGEASSAAALRAAVRACGSAATVELMCHPGYAGSGGDDFNRSPAREHELAVLLARPFASLVDAGRVALSTFAALHARRMTA
jgi:predicted glycoside hydrolase/deacetylase ChbG (UPF0249 family)